MIDYMDTCLQMCFQDGFLFGFFGSFAYTTDLTCAIFLFFLAMNCFKLVTISDSGSRDAKLSYIKNLMVNYLSSDRAVRDHMEGAIGTVLKFTPEEVAKIEKKKQEQQDTWF